MRKQTLRFATDAEAPPPAGRGATRLPPLADLAAEIKALLADEWLPQIYRERILTLRTRSHALGAAAGAKKSGAVAVQHTLLGVELKIGSRRLHCPDLTTARYLAVFARLGCAEEVAVPYDITVVSRLADDLESSWHRMLLFVGHLAAERRPAFRSRLGKLLTAQARAEIAAAGAGARVPQFNQNTKQRPAAAPHPRRVA